MARFKNDLQVFVEQLNEQIEKETMLNESKEDKQISDSEKHMMRMDEIERKRISLFESRKKVKSDLLTLFIKEMFNPIIEDNELYSTSLSYNIASSFVNEEGASSLLKTFKRNTFFLEDVADFIEETAKNIISSRKDDEIVKLTEAEKDDFVNNIKDMTPANVAQTIKDKVSDTVEDVIQRNKQNSETIKGIIDKANKRKEEIKSDALKEEYTANVKRRIKDGIDKRNVSVLEYLITTNTERALKNPDKYNDVLVENNDINMSKIFNNSVIIYSFLETLNTLYIKPINADYLLELFA